MSSSEIPPIIKPENPIIKTQTINPKLNQVETKYGHFPYQEMDGNQLIIVSIYGEREKQIYQKLAIEAASALIRVIFQARQDGVWIIPISGFRTFEYQTKLFNHQIKRRGSPEIAAKFTAPPGYSEHHTGYTIDLGDGHFPQCDIEVEFEETEAFKWLEIHSKEFGFELSFPKNNFQGINYEPWHWRYIGSPKAKEIFYNVRIKMN